MRASRIGSATAVGGVLALAAAPIAGWADSAPPGQATGTAVQVGVQGAPDPVVGVSSTSATATDSGSSSSAQTVQVLGQNVGPSGSSQNGAPANGSGDLASTPAGSPVQASVAQYDVSSSAPKDGSSQSSADSTLTHANAGGDSGVTADVARSQSSASYSDDGSGNTNSTGKSSSDGAVINAGGSSGLTVHVLHSDASSTGDGTQPGVGNSYLLEIAGGGQGSGPIGTSSDIGQVCTALSNSLVQLACVEAAGGFNNATGHPFGSGQVLDLAIPMPSGGNLLSVALFRATAGDVPAAAPTQSTKLASPAVLTSGGPSLAPTSANSPAGGPAGGPGAPAASPTSSSSGPSGGLPFTGFDLELILLASGLLLTAGGAAVRISSVVKPRLAG